MFLNVLGVTCGYGAHPVLRNASVQIQKRDFVGIVGPNGSGKSTLLRTISRVLRPLSGEVRLEEEEIYRTPAVQIARKMAVAPQEQGLDFPFTVRDIVAMGRIPHLKRFAREGSKDIQAIERAMELTDTIDLAQRQANALSGGEKQRVLLARALAQEPQILLLDEPTSYLDLNYQIELMELLAELRRDHGLTIVMVLHDLNLASNYCDYLVVMKQGVIFAVGSPHQIITAPLIKEVYGCEVKVECPNPLERPYLVLNTQKKQEPCLKSEHKVHIVGGGGAGLLLFRNLSELGWKISTGAVNEGDSDWLEAKKVGIRINQIPPFCSISEKEATLNREMMQKADYIIMASVPFGTGNIKNLEGVLEQAQTGAKVIVVNSTAIANRDYTGGKATELYQKLLNSGVVVVDSEWEAIRLMEGATENAAQR